MESKVRLAGHAIHPMLVVFPLGLLATAVIFDVITLVTHNGKFSEAGYYMIGAGIIAGVVAQIFGLVDWINIPDGTRAKRVGLWHGVGNVAVMVLFAASWFLRRGSIGDPSMISLSLSFAGVGLALITAWLGAELVERHGVGVADDAHLNAASSFKQEGHATGRA